MARRYCFAPNCTSGYSNNKDKASLFKVPKNKLKEWSAVIPRADKKLEINDVLCEKHFFKEDVIREVVTETYSYPLKIPRLSEDAKPSIWPNCPSYLSKKPVKKRKIVVRHEYVPPAKRKKVHNASDTNKVLDKPSVTDVVTDVPVVPSTSQEDNHNISAIIDEDINTEDNKSWLLQLHSKLWKNNITLPSESWTIKFHKNIIAIFETVESVDDIVFKKKIVFTPSFLNFFIFQHLHESLTETSHNKINDVADFEKKLIYFDKLSICYGLKVKSLNIDLSSSPLTLYRKDEFSQSVRHKNCKYLMSTENNLCKNTIRCLKCQNARYAIRYLKARATKTSILRNSLLKKNSINCRKRERRINHTQSIKEEIVEREDEMEVQKKIDQMDNLSSN